MNAINEPQTLLYIPGTTIPDRELLEEIGLADFTGHIVNVVTGPDGGHGWLLCSTAAVDFDATAQAWLYSGLYWVGEAVEPAEGAA